MTDKQYVVLMRVLTELNTKVYILVLFVAAILGVLVGLVVSR